MQEEGGGSAESWPAIGEPLSPPSVLEEVNHQSEDQIDQDSLGIGLDGLDESSGDLSNKNAELEDVTEDEDTKEEETKPKVYKYKDLFSAARQWRTVNEKVLKRGEQILYSECPESRGGIKGLIQLFLSPLIPLFARRKRKRKREIPLTLTNSKRHHKEQLEGEDADEKLGGAEETEMDEEKTREKAQNKKRKERKEKDILAEVDGISLEEANSDDDDLDLEDEDEIDEGEDEDSEIEFEDEDDDEDEEEESWCSCIGKQSSYRMEEVGLPYSTITRRFTYFWVLTTLGLVTAFTVFAYLKISTFITLLFFHLFLVCIALGVILLVYLSSELMLKMCYILTNERALIVYNIGNNILVLGCSYHQMNMMKIQPRSAATGVGHVKFRRDLFESPGFWLCSTVTVHQSEWGFEEIATPEIVENIIMDIGASGGGMIPDLELPPLDLYDDGDTDIGGDDDDANAAKKFLVSSSFFDNSVFEIPHAVITASRAHEIYSVIQLYCSIPILLTAALLTHPTFALIYFVALIFSSMIGLRQFQLLRKKHFNPGPIIAAMLLALVGTFVCLMDLLESTHVLPFFGLEVGPLSFPLVDSLFLRIVLDVVTAGVMIGGCVVAAINLKKLSSFLRKFYLFRIRDN